MTDVLPCGLEHHFGEVADQLPVERGEVYRFDAAGVPAPPPRLSTPAIRVRLGYKAVWFNDDIIEMREVLSIEATKRAYRLWGILILAGVFHASDDPIVIGLNHPDSAIRDMRVGGRPLIAGDPRGYVTSPLSFEYSPGESHRYPWPGAVDEEHLPCFWFARAGMDVERSKVVGFGTDRASVRLAELLLNIGLPANPLDEYLLDGDSFDISRGTSARSGPLQPRRHHLASRVDRLQRS